MWTFQRPRQSGPAAREAQVLRDLSEIAALQPDLRALQTALAARFRDIAGCRAVMWCGHDADHDTYHSVSGNGSEAPVRFRAHGPLAQWREANDDHLWVPDDVGVFEYLDEDERQTLSSHYVRLCLPVMGTERLVAILLFIDDAPRLTLSAADRALLLVCARQAAVACDTAARQHAKHSHVRSLHRADQLVVAGQMAAAVAHEVRNPLATIRSTIQYVVTSSSAWDHKRGLLEQTLQEVDRIDHTVSGMLSLSRPSTLTMTDTDMTQVVRDALTLIRSYVEDHHVDLQVDLGHPLVVVGDVRELRQVFVNLLLNACQAMTHGGRLVVTADVVLEDRPASLPRYGVIRMADSGPGIPGAHLEKIFDPFYTTKPGGTGLGLPVCLEIVSRHQGRLDITCPAHGGTVASVLLPLKVSASWPAS